MIENVATNTVIEGRTPPEVGAEEASSAIARAMDIKKKLAVNHCLPHVMSDQDNLFL